MQPVVRGAEVVHAGYGAVGDAERKVLDGYVAGIEFLGEKAYEGAKKVGQVAADVKEKAGFFWNAARDKVFGIHENLSPESQINDPVNVNVPVFIFGSAPGQNNRAPRDNGGSPMSPGVWLTVDVPENVALLAFDFTLHGDPQDACLVCAAGGENIFSTQLKFMDEDAPQSVDPIDISAYTGQRVELFSGSLAAPPPKLNWKASASSPFHSPL